MSHFEDLGFAKVDLHRGQRQGFPEVIFCLGKTPRQAAEIFGVLARREPVVLATRATETHFRAIQKKVKNVKYFPEARCVVKWSKEFQKKIKTSSFLVAVLAAGTSDMLVAEEAAITAMCFGAKVERAYDVGVAGLHRLFAQCELLKQASVIIVVAGMEGALPSVVAGLVDKPVIAVPTSVGYGANFSGLAALLGMLNSCGSGVTVVNIDNGFGAGFAAGQILRLTHVVK
ncbi:MAG: nickel pincer cofactor biosynthesis protein LarB [Verrucomicrobiae bacterium]|nr:nickel pincer cofactor biosynthesis protein LarB [Verrucomicrobiae bacterium]